MKSRKSLFLPPGLNTDRLDTLFQGFQGRANLTNSTCLLYTFLCQDLVRLHLRNDQDGYTQLHSNRLEILFGEGYKRIMETLRSHNLIEVNHENPDTGEYHPEGYYSKAAKQSRAYRIPRHLRRDDRLFKRVPLPSTSKVLLNKIGRLNGVTTDLAVEADAYRSFILRKMSKTVLLDTPTTHDIIRDIYLRQGLAYSPSLGAAMIETFNHSPVHCPTICAFAKRVHSQVTNQYKQLRPQLRFEHDLDAELVEIDLVASQPWFLSIVCPRLIKKFVPECADAIPLFKQVARQADVIVFREKCANPRPNEGIYGYLRDVYNRRYGENFTRDEAKAICYRAFFSDYQRKEKTTVAKCSRSAQRWERRVVRAQAHPVHLVASQTKLKARIYIMSDAEGKLKKAKLFTQKCYELFRALFPSLHRLFAGIKQLPWDFDRGQQQGKKTKYYANNALLAQRLESNIVYGVVIKALMAANITNVFTIHDAFVVRKKDEIKARKVIKKAFSSIRLKSNLK